MTVYTVIIGNYDDLKQPFVVTPGWKYVCFTDQDFELPANNVWEIRKVKQLDCGPIKTQREIKINFHKYIGDEFSLYVDGTFFINCDLDAWWSRFRAPFTTIQHPFDNCVYKEIQSVREGGKAHSMQLRNQSDCYRRLGLKQNKGLIASGILMRQRTPGVEEFCRKWWQQVHQWTARDQIAFAYVDHKLPGSHVSIKWDYTTETEFIHVPHLTKPWRSARLREVIQKYGSSKTT